MSRGTWLAEQSTRNIREKPWNISDHVWSDTFGQTRRCSSQEEQRDRGALLPHLVCSLLQLYCFPSLPLGLHKASEQRMSAISELQSAFRL